MKFIKWKIIFRAGLYLSVAVQGSFPRQQSVPTLNFHTLFWRNEALFYTVGPKDTAAYCVGHVKRFCVTTEAEGGWGRLHEDRANQGRAQGRILTFSRDIHRLGESVSIITFSPNCVIIYSHPKTFIIIIIHLFIIKGNQPQTHNHHWSMLYMLFSPISTSSLHSDKLVFGGTSKKH